MSDLVGDLVRDFDELAVVLVLVAFVLPHLQDDLVGAWSLVGVFVGQLDAGQDRGNVLAVAADLPLQPAAPVVADRCADHLAAFEPDLGFRGTFKNLVHVSDSSRSQSSVVSTSRSIPSFRVVGSIHKRSRIPEGSENSALWLRRSRGMISGICSAPTCPRATSL